MKLINNFRYAGKSLVTHKLRSFLTILGVLIGIAAITSLSSLSNGFETTVKSQFEEGFSTKTLVVHKDIRLFEENDPSFQLYYNNITAFQDIDHVILVVPIIQIYCYAIFNNSDDEIVPIFGVDFSNFGVLYPNRFIVENGIIPSEANSTQFVIGDYITNVVNIGESINITAIYGNQTYKGTVAGSLKNLGGLFIGIGPSDEGIYLQIEKMKEIFDIEIVTYFILMLDDNNESIINSVSSEIDDMFNSQVQIISPIIYIEAIESTFSSIESFLGTIATISLIVGGIGIMNTMFISLIQRKREIGILKALGMKNESLIMVFLSESIIIGLVGSLVGIGMGWIFANVFSGYIGDLGTQMMGVEIGIIQPIFTLSLIRDAFFFGIGVSIIFGLYPAWAASRLEPIKTLRYE
ncbi:MAG: FtsX-like permease family protein [Candidatus Lokiarchaeota archaeon]|nr:FtsX-like permease family protein [Candidatus Lokiarchaeota archaeon]